MLVVSRVASIVHKRTRVCVCEIVEGLAGVVGPFQVWLAGRREGVGAREWRAARACEV